VLGVYALPVTAELLREQTDILYGAGLTGEARQWAERSCREQLASTVLVEALVRGRDGRFQPGDFCQPRDGVARDNWQVAWAEAYLTTDGQSRLEDPRWGEPPETEDFRVAFFIHYWEADCPLRSTYGEFNCPPVQEMPERLRKLVPYEPLD
jgi:hypothetical protein